MSVPTLAGIHAETIDSRRIRTRVLFSGPSDGEPVIFLHGNTSSATWWEETMLALPPGYRGIAPDQRGFGEADPEVKVDARQGLADLAEDAAALLDKLGIERAHLAAHSLGGYVGWRLLAEHGDRLRTATLVDPGSPYGFGCTKDVLGTPCYPDYAGSGGGLVNPELIKRMAAGDRSLESMFSPRAALRSLIVKPPFVPAREEDLLSAMLSEHIGPQDQPGDGAPSPNWPFVGPGVWGAANGLSPRYAMGLERLLRAEPKAPVLWVRGSHDLIVSDTAASDVGFLGMVGAIPGWPGKEIFPPQPMVSQIRSALDGYAAHGGAYREVVIQDAGHSPYVEKPEEFNAIFHEHIRR